LGAWASLLPAAEVEQVAVVVVALEGGLGGEVIGAVAGVRTRATVGAGEAVDGPPAAVAVADLAGEGPLDCGGRGALESELGRVTG
jgi:hypothetical protein